MTIKKSQLLIFLVLSVCFKTYSGDLSKNNIAVEKELDKTKKDKATIYLKNGSVIYGTIEQNGEIVVIKTRDGNIFAYSKTEIEKIDLNTKPPIANSSYHQFGFGVSHSATEFNGAFNVVNGYQLGSKYYMGLGIGIEGYFNRVYVPLTLDVQYHPFSDWNSQPYIGANFGKLLLQSDENKGWLTGVQIGFSHALGNRVDILTSIGYRYGIIERESNSFNPWDNFIDDGFRRFEFNRLEFRLGFMIK